MIGLIVILLLSGCGDGLKKKLRKATCNEAATMEIGWYSYDLCMEDDDFFNVTSFVVWRTNAYIRDRLYQSVAPDIAPKLSLVLNAKPLQGSDLQWFNELNRKEKRQGQRPEGIFFIDGHLEWDGESVRLRDNFGFYSGKAIEDMFSVPAYLLGNAGTHTALKKACRHGRSVGGRTKYECSGRFYILLKQDQLPDFIVPVLAVSPEFSDVKAPPLISRSWRRELLPHVVAENERFRAAVTGR